MDTTNLARAVIGQGMGMGWGDEGEAWLRSKLGDEEYDDALKRIRSEYGHYAKTNPGTAATAEFVGGAAPGVAAMMLPGMQSVGANQVARSGIGAAARMGLAGAATGAIAGSGAAEEGDRMSGAGTGAVLGGALGLAIPAGIRAAGGASNWLKERLATMGANPSESTAIKDAASRKMLNAMNETGTTPQQITNTAAEDAARQIPSVVANTDSGLNDLARSVAQRTGSGARKIENTLGEQRLGTKERAVQQTNKALQPGDYYGDLDKIKAEMKTRAGPLYEQAYAHGEVTDPEVLKFLQLPQFQQGLGEAQKLLAAEGRTVDMSKPTVEVLDQVKRGLDTLIEKETDAVTGKTTSLGRVYTQKKNEFLDALDKAVPDYELARGVYRGGAELQDAMRKGLTEFDKTPHQQIVKLIAGMSESEKQAYRTGVTQKIYNDVMTTSNNMNAAQKAFGGPERQAKLQPLFDNPGEFSLFKAAMERESQLFQQSNNVLGGASTSKNQQMRGVLESDDGITDVINRSVTGGLKNGLLGMVLGAVNSAKMTEKTAAKLADMLMAKDPHEVAAVVKLLEDYQKKAVPAAVRSSKAQMGATTGTLGAIYPAPIDPASVMKDDTTADEAIKADKRNTSRDLIERDLGLLDQ